MTQTCLTALQARHVTELQQELLGFMNSIDWPRIRIQCGLFFVAWEYTLDDFHRVTSNPQLTLGEAKAAMRDCAAR